MTRDDLLNSICPMSRVYDCCIADGDYDCDNCKRLIKEWLDEYDKQIRTEVINEYYNKINEKLKADTNLKDTIREIHDNVAQEMYCKGIDDLTEKVKDYFVIPHDARVIEMTAEQLKEQNK